MADVFISYKSEDRDWARRIAVALEGEGFDVWWDPALKTGEDYQEVIDRMLRDALVVVVLWSARSVRSRWVRSEATIGDRYGALAPVMIESCELPTAFVLVQTADLSRWDGTRDDACWREFRNDVAMQREKRRSERAANSRTLPDAEAVESIFWQSIRDSADVGDFESYLRRYPSGHFVDLARNRIVVLRTSARAHTSERVSLRAAEPTAFGAPTATQNSGQTSATLLPFWGTVLWLLPIWLITAFVGRRERAGLGLRILLFVVYAIFCVLALYYFIFALPLVFGLNLLGFIFLPKTTSAGWRSFFGERSAPFGATLSLAGYRFLASLPSEASRWSIFLWLVALLAFVALSVFSVAAVLVLGLAMLPAILLFPLWAASRWRGLFHRTFRVEG